MTLWEIFAGNPLRISFTYVILVIESILGALIPYYLGKGVDGILSSSWLMFGVFIGICLALEVVKCFRMMYDTRAFGHIWKQVSVRAISGMIRRNVESSKIINRDELVQRFVDFYEISIPNVVCNLIAFFSAVVMVFILVGGIPAAITLSLASLTLLLGLFFAGLNKKMDIVRTEACEKKYSMIEKRNTEGVRSAYGELIRSYIKRSDYSAWRFVSGALPSLLSIIVIVSFGNIEELTAGMIIAIITYIWQLFGSVDGISDFMEEVREIETAREKLAEVNA